MGRNEAFCGHCKLHQTSISWHWHFFSCTKFQFSLNSCWTLWIRYFCFNWNAVNYWVKWSQKQPFLKKQILNLSWHWHFFFSLNLTFYFTKQLLKSSMHCGLFLRQLNSLDYFLGSIKTLWTISKASLSFLTNKRYFFV